MPLTHADVAASVRAELARVGVSGRQAARDLDWAPARMERRLNGTTPFSINELAQVANYLGLPIALFVSPPAPAEQAS